MTHDFHERLAWGEQAGDEPFWDAVYNKAFHGVVAIQRNSGKNLGQYLGVDRWIMLSNGQTLRVDEKKRSREYGDIALEYLSNDRTGAKGWIEKDLPIDWLAYAFMATGRCYLFPWPVLRRIWGEHGEEWKRKHGTKVADNRDYRTHFVPVPISVLLDAVRQAQVVEVAPMLEEAA